MNNWIWQRRFPTLAKLFVPTYLQANHPIGALLSSESESLSSVAYKTDRCAKLVENIDPSWLKRKVKIIKHDNNLKNVSGAVGEVRAYGELITAFGEENVVAQTGKGPDFLLTVEDHQVCVEVNAPQWTDKQTRREVERTVTGNISMSISEVAPFGFPTREKDTFGGECVHKLAGIKGDEDQFREDLLNILWLDCNDPALSVLAFQGSHVLPLISGTESLTSGCLWNAFYAKKGDPIFGSVRATGETPTFYEMEFDGRFQGSTKIDFAIIDIFPEIIVYQNPNRAKKAPDRLFQSYFSFVGFNFSHCWIDWPVHGSLAGRIDHARRETCSCLKAFRIP
jgi:hypothetical protein